MIALRGLQRVTSLASGTSIRTASKSYSSSARRRQNSPFLGLFARHKDHQSAKHLLLRRRQYSAQTEFPKTPSPKQSVPDESNKSWSQRFKDLSRKYGWAAVGTYFALSILDYPFFFLAVRSIGAERIGHYEHAVLEWINATLPFELPRIRWPWQKQTVEGEEVGVASTNSDPKTSASGSVGKKEGASLWTQAVIAYALHKSFIFLRVPLTVAVTPRVVRTLRGWGWNVGNRAPKVGQVAAQSGK